MEPDLSYKSPAVAGWAVGLTQGRDLLLLLFRVRTATYTALQHGVTLAVIACCARVWAGGVKSMVAMGRETRQPFRE